VIAFVEESRKSSLTITDKHQFGAPHDSGEGDRPGNVQLWAIDGSSNASWPWPWIKSRSHQHTQSV